MYGNHGTVRRIATALFWGAACADAGFSQAPFRDFFPRPIPFFVEGVADVDGDGRPDVFAGSGAALNDGYGTSFRTSPLGNTLTSYYEGRVVGDVNGDGHDDLVTPTEVRLLQPGTSPVFLQTQTLSLGGPPFLNALGGGVDLGDVDADGDLDAVAGSRLQVLNPAPTFVAGPVRLWLNNGLGTFTAAPTTAFPPGTTAGVQTFLRDFDGDGDLDLLSVNDVGYAAAPPTFLLNDGTGTFGPPPSPLPFPFSVDAWLLACGDFDGDGSLDIAGVASSAVAAPLYVAFNGPAGFATGPVSTAFPGSWIPMMVPVDVTGDGAAELVVMSQSVVTTPPGTTTVYHVLPSGALTAGWSRTECPLYPGQYYGTGAELTPDLDGDGDADLLLRSSVGTCVPALNDRAGGFFLVGDPSPSFLFGGTFVADFDGDGDLDGCSAGSFSPGAAPLAKIRLSDGVGGFSDGPTTALPNLSMSFAPVDYDGDGDTDLYGFVNSTTQGDRLFTNVGGGAFAAGAQPGTSGHPTAVEVVDADLDGDLDLLLGRRPSTGLGATRLLRNVGGGFAAPTVVAANTAAVEFAAGDFDGDGAPDLLELNAPNGGTPSAVVYLSVGTTPTAVAQSFAGTGFAVAEDLDFDGDSDAVVGGTVYLSTGGNLAAVGALSQPLSHRASCEDVDGDGLRDLVQRDGGVYFRTGPTTFAPRVGAAAGSAVPGGGFSDRPRFEDFDRDGDPDLLSIAPNFLVNTTRQLRHAGPVRIGYPADVDVFGSPGSTALLFAAPNVADYVAAPGLRVLIDPATAQFVATVPLGVAGSATPGFASLPVSVPNAPALVGLSLHWQAIETTQGRLTNRLTSTVLSF
jgi:hypothetical protein